MADTLKYYIAYTYGLNVLRDTGGTTTEMGSFFEGKILEHITGCRENLNVVPPQVRHIFIYPDNANLLNVSL